MSQHGTLALPPEGRVDPERFVPALPPGLSILPGQVTASRSKGRLRRIVLPGLAGLAVLIWLFQWYSGYDGKRIDAVVTPLMYQHVKFGTRLPVTLWSGPRILSIGSSFLEPGVDPPTTCVSVYVYDPQTGAIDPSYRNQYFDCISGLSYVIPYPLK
jgi:hypothetical protein